MIINLKKHLWSLLIFTIVLIGIFLRVYVYLQNVSFFHDEGGLALNLLEKSYGQLFFKLDYNQQAPPLFLILSKFMVSEFGVSELALRFMPCCFSIASLILFAFLCFKTFKTCLSIAVALFLFSFSVSFVHFAQVFTKYSSDIFCTVLVLFVVFSLDFKKLTGKKVLLLSVLTAISFWFSYTMVFTVFSIGLVFLVKSILSKDSDNIKKCILFLNINFLVVVFYSFLNLYESATREGLYECWVNIGGFFPNTLIEIKNLFFFLFNIHSMFGIFAICILFILGLVTWYKKDNFKFWILVLPIISVFMAGAFHLYPASDRLLLFLMPNIIIILVSSLDTVFFECSTISKINIVFLFIIFLTSTRYLPYFIDYIKYKYDYERSGIREYVSLLKKEKIDKNTLIYANLHCKECFQFYEKDLSFSKKQIFFEEPCYVYTPIGNMKEIPRHVNVYFFIFYNLLTPKEIFDEQQAWIEKNCIIEKDIKMKNKRFIKCYLK